MFTEVPSIGIHGKSQYKKNRNSTIRIQLNELEKYDGKSNTREQKTDFRCSFFPNLNTLKNMAQPLVHT